MNSNDNIQNIFIGVGIFIFLCILIFLIYHVCNQERESTRNQEPGGQISERSPILAESRSYNHSRSSSRRTETQIPEVVYELCYSTVSSERPIYVRS